jgi:hypothetical protein
VLTITGLTQIAPFHKQDPNERRQWERSDRAEGACFMCGRPLVDDRWVEKLEDDEGFFYSGHPDTYYGDEEPEPPTCSKECYDEWRRWKHFRGRIICGRCGRVVTVEGDIWEARLGGDREGVHKGWNCDACADVLEGKGFADGIGEY